MEQNESAQCTQDKQEGSDFSHLQEGFEMVAFDNRAAAFNRAALAWLYIKILHRKHKLFLNNVKRGFSVPFFSINHVRESVEIDFGGSFT